LIVAVLAAQEDPSKKDQRTDEKASKKKLDDLPQIKELERKEPGQWPAGGEDSERLRKIVERLHKNMDKSEEQLNKKDPGEDTRKIQQDIIKDLDELIKQQSKGDGGGGASSSSSASKGASNGNRSSAANSGNRKKRRTAKAATRPPRVSPAKKVKAVTAWAANRTPRTKRTKTPSPTFSRTFGGIFPRRNDRKWTPTPGSDFCANTKRSCGNTTGRSPSKTVAGTGNEW
jgi:hypothetical protein